MEPYITFFAIGQSVFKIERRIGEDFAAVGADEALRVESLAHGFQAILQKVCEKDFTYGSVTIYYIGHLFSRRN